MPTYFFKDKNLFAWHHDEIKNTVISENFLKATEYRNVRI